MPTLPPPGSLTWLAIAAFVVGGVVRALKADALPAILTRFLRPEGPPIAIPTRALPFLALVFGTAAAVLNSRVAGASWEVAAQDGVTAAAFAVFGHELLSGVPGTRKLLGGVLLLVGLAGGVSACSFLTPKNIRSVLDATAITCVFASELTDEKAVASVCGVADDLIPVLRNLIAQREASRRAGIAWGDGLEMLGPPDGGAPLLDAGTDAGAQ
jgi:hypothetical protein